MNTVFGAKIEGKIDGYHFPKCTYFHPSEIGTEKTYSIQGNMMAKCFGGSYLWVVSQTVALLVWHNCPLRPVQ